jgi:hypothetical protein
MLASVYSRSDQERFEHNGVVKWIDEWLGGKTAARYIQGAEEALGTHKDPEDGNSGTPYMEHSAPVEEL